MDDLSDPLLTPLLDHDDLRDEEMSKHLTPTEIFRLKQVSRTCNEAIHGKKIESVVARNAVFAIRNGLSKRISSFLEARPGPRRLFGMMTGDDGKKEQNEKFHKLGWFLDLITKYDPDFALKLTQHQVMADDETLHMQYSFLRIANHFDLVPDEGVLHNSLGNNH